MKPGSLKLPYAFDAPKIMMQDRVWHIPYRSTTTCSYKFPGWDHADFFGNAQPVNIEYCSGNGAWIASKARDNPQSNWVAIERKFSRVRKVWAKIKKLQLNNLIVIFGEGFETTRQFIPEDSISSIYINFPDPWPKHRHTKNRIIQTPFVNEMYRILKNDGPMTFVTDDSGCSEWLIRTMHCCPGFVSAYGAPYYIQDWEGYGTSYFEELWRSKGCTIRYHQFIKRPNL